MNKNNLESINNFLNHVDYDIFYLGCIIMTIKEKINEKILFLQSCGTTHAVIYSRNIIDYYNTLSCQEICSLSIGGWDAFINIYIKKKYTFIESLVVQPFPLTENRTTSWSNFNLNLNIWINRTNNKNDQLLRKLIVKILRKKLPLEDLNILLNNVNVLELLDTNNNPRLIFDLVNKIALIRYDLFKKNKILV